MTTTPEHIGDVGVDSGYLWLGDPCYVMGEDAPAVLQTWEEFLARTFDPRYQTGAAGVSQPVGEEVGMAMPAGYGDGVYPVYATYNSQGRIATLTVDFLAGETDDDEVTAD
jgi:hypothetical protein